jgi:hypothetical protein
MNSPHDQLYWQQYSPKRLALADPRFKTAWLQPIQVKYLRWREHLLGYLDTISACNPALRNAFTE